MLKTPVLVLLTVLLCLTCSGDEADQSGNPGSAPDAGAACAATGGSCAPGKACCAGLMCCAGAMIPIGAEFCDQQCPVPDKDRGSTGRPTPRSRQR
jgi:hypothetical protein